MLPAAVRPDYGGAWIGGIVPALLRGADVAWLPEPARAAGGTVLLVLDGLGWSLLEAHRAELPTLATMVGTSITAAVPSTTAAGLTSITTGATPGAHGLVGYRMRVAAQVLNVLSWTVPHRGTPPDPAATQPVAPFLGRRVPVVTQRSFRDTGFTTATMRGADYHGWLTPATLVEHVRGLVGAGSRFVYAYYDGVDKVAHSHGLHDAFLAAELRAADALVAALLDVLPPDRALVVTADHGHVHVGTDGFRSLAVLHPLVATYAGEGRFRSLYAKAGAAADLAAAAVEVVGDSAWVFTRDELCDDGWLGPEVAPAVRGRIGDVVLAPHAPVAYLDPTYPREAQLVSVHGSLTAAELQVPLLAAYGNSSRRGPA